MYYDNKSAFYMKQYGPAIIVTALSVALIGSGIYIYLKSGNIDNKPKQEEVANLDTESKSNDNITNEENTVEETKNTQEVVQPVSTTKTISDELTALEMLQKSKAYKVESVTDSGAIVIANDSSKEEIYLIGADFSNSKNDAVKKMREDLSSKNVQIAFDAEKIEDSKMYAYVYIDNSLYNETLLKSGVATLRVERKNINLLDRLLKAQLEAKNTNTGIWR